MGFLFEFEEDDEEEWFTMQVYIYFGVNLMKKDKSMRGLELDV